MHSLSKIILLSELSLIPQCHPSTRKRCSMKMSVRATESNFSPSLKYALLSKNKFIAGYGNCDKLWSWSFCEIKCTAGRLYKFTQTWLFDTIEAVRLKLKRWRMVEKWCLWKTWFEWRSRAARKRALWQAMSKARWMLSKSHLVLVKKSRRMGKCSHLPQPMVISSTSPQPTLLTQRTAMESSIPAQTGKRVATSWMSWIWLRVCWCFSWCSIIFDLVRGITVRLKKRKSAWVY